MLGALLYAVGAWPFNRRQKPTTPEMRPDSKRIGPTATPTGSAAAAAPESPDGDMEAFLEGEFTAGGEFPG
jgi:hypothetical protein